MEKETLADRSVRSALTPWSMHIVDRYAKMEVNTTGITGWALSGYKQCDGGECLNPPNLTAVTRVRLNAAESAGE